ncbi:MAG: hypothetical protein MAG715_00420 [Methanonatronarchaeales archaeon]|nr:hypothetical protein [Methanonatronarchaeales archaeon]
MEPAVSQDDSAVVETATPTGKDRDGGGGDANASVIETGRDGTTLFGLLPMWKAAYIGEGTHDYDFDDDGQQTTGQCGNCHMGGGSKHDPPFHPIGLNSRDSGEWFFDADRQSGPNTRLASQPSGLRPAGGTLFCGDCHTPSNLDGFGDPQNSGRTGDPHAVHRDVMAREDCLRCHIGKDQSFSGAVTFTQGGAKKETKQIADPINMVRVWDGKLLSTPEESIYDANGAQVDGGGWSRYLSPDSEGAVRASCGDCHGVYHMTGGRRFTFDDSAESRRGPIAEVEHDESPEVSSGDNVFTCGQCHVTDVHAVHTNGEINDRVNYRLLTDMSENVTNPGAVGAEFCPVCHGQAAA